MRTRRTAAVAVAMVIAAGCGGASDPVLVEPVEAAGTDDSASTAAPPTPPEPDPTATASPTPLPPATASPNPLPPATPMPTAAPAATVPPTAIPVPTWFLEVEEIDDELAAVMTPTSWREGCPVTLDELRLLRFPHAGFDGEIATAELIVHERYAADIGQVFQRLFDARYPIQRIELVDAYGGDDRASMQANNTSGFNCREVGTGSGVWSNHAFGTAVDLNPLMNPLVQGSFVDPPEGEVFLDRTDVRPGMIVAGDAAVEAFTEIGWIWGGTWRSLKDYQHFSDDGR